MALVSDSHKFIFVHIPKNAGTSIELALKDYCTAESLLRPDTNPHETAVEARVRIGKEKFDEYFKFAVCRNPYDRELSYFFYANQSWFFSVIHAKAKKYGKLVELDTKSDHSNAFAKRTATLQQHHLPASVMGTYQTWLTRVFKEWARGELDLEMFKIENNNLSPGKPFMGSPHRAQASYLLDEDGNNTIDFLIRFEHMQEDFDHVCGLLGLPKIELSHERYSREIWPDSTRHNQAHIHSCMYDDEVEKLLLETYEQDFEMVENFFKEKADGASL